MSKQLLVDYIPFSVSPEQINESLSKNGGRLIVKGTLQRADAKNQNGRIYPADTLMREAENYSKVQIKERRALGELDHPDSSVVNLNNASHNILEMHWNGKDLVGTVEVLGTPSGNILKELFKSGIKLGISSRGLGSVEKLGEADEKGNQTVKVKDDFELIAFDFVSNPSTQGAFMAPLKEGVEPKICSVDCKIESIINDIFRGE
ncbi:MAG: primosomal protein [Candidatus Pelagibacter sp.]|nr:primosomal protein [Candidatus Pelagibacter sp.]